MEEALRELRAAPDGEGAQLGARIDEEADAVVRDAAAPREVERRERGGAVLGERREREVGERGHVVEREGAQRAAAAVRERRQTKEIARRAVEEKDIPMAVYSWLELSVCVFTQTSR